LRSASLGLFADFLDFADLGVELGDFLFEKRCAILRRPGVDPEMAGYDDARPTTAMAAGLNWRRAARLVHDGEVG
jgi:hypothetical protein